MNTLSPFKGLELVVNLKDVEQIRALLDPDKEGFELVCDDCSGSSFKVRVLIEADLDLSINNRYEQAIIRDHEVLSISAVKVLKCATCGSEDFICDKRGGQNNVNEKGNVCSGESSDAVGCC